MHNELNKVLASGSTRLFLEVLESYVAKKGLNYFDYVEDFYWNLMWTPVLIWSDLFMKSLTLSNLEEKK